MTVRPIVLLSEAEPLLRRKSKRQTNLDSSLQPLIEDMIATMRAAHGVGLAAPQVGVPLRVVVIEVPEEEVRVLINPEIVKATDLQEVEEGCLSIPGYFGRIQRYASVTAKARDRFGRAIRLKGEGLLAQAIQHEIDHLNGTLFIDHLDSLDRLYKLTEGSLAQEAVTSPGHPSDPSER